MRRSLPTLAILTLLRLAAAAQEPVITPGDNLVAQGVPAIPASLAAEVRATPNRAP